MTVLRVRAVVTALVVASSVVALSAVTLTLLVAGSARAEGVDPLQSWSPPADATGGPYVPRQTRASVSEFLGIAPSDCPAYVSTWTDAGRHNVITAGVQYCPTPAAAQTAAAVDFDAFESLPGPPLFGDEVDFVTSASVADQQSCSLHRTWAEGSLLLSVMTLSRRITPTACAELNARLSRSLSALADGEPAPRANRTRDVLSTLVVNVVISAWILLVGVPTAWRLLTRDRYRLPDPAEPFVDVGRRARRTERRSFMWGGAVVGRRVSVVLAVLAFASVVLSTTWGSPGWSLLVCLAVTAALTVVVRRLGDPTFVTGNHALRRLLRRRPTARGVIGGVLQAVARSALPLVLAMYVSGVIFLSVGGRYGTFGRGVVAQVERASGAQELSVLGAVRVLLLFSHDHAIDLAALILPVAGVAFLLNRLGERLTAQSAHELLAADTRPPVLYLRSFGDDRLKLYGSRLSRRGLLGRLSPFRRRRFEEVVVRRLNLVGPVIAVSDPRRPLPDLGAAKLNLPHGDTWRDEVESRARTALCVVVSATPADVNDGLYWELQMLAERLGHRRVVLLLGAMPRGELVRRWAVFRDASAHLPLFGWATRAGAGGAAQLVVHHPVAGWIGYGAKVRDEWTYVTAIQAAFDAIGVAWRDEVERRRDAGTAPVLDTAWSAPPPVAREN